MKTFHMSLQSKSKHAEIRHLLVKDWVKKNRLTMVWQKTIDMLADIGTKNLPADQFVRLRDQLTGYQFAREILEHRCNQSQAQQTLAFARIVRASGMQR